MKGYLCWAFHCVSYLLSPIVVVQSLSHVWLFVTPWTAAWQASLSFTIFWSLLKFMPTELVMLSNRLIFCCSLSLLPSIFPGIRVFYTELTLHIRWLKYGSFSFSFSIIPSNEYSGLISLRIDWFDFLVVQGTLKSLLQHYSLKGSILQHSAFIMVQLSYLYMITGKWLSGRWVWGKKWFYSLANKGSPVSWEQWITIKSQNEAICSHHSVCLHGGLVQTRVAKFFAL